MLPAAGLDGADGPGEIHYAQTVSDSNHAGVGAGAGLDAGVGAGAIHEASIVSGSTARSCAGVHYSHAVSDNAVFEPLLRALDEHNVVHVVCAVATERR